MLILITILLKLLVIIQKYKNTYVKNCHLTFELQVKKS